VHAYGRAFAIAALVPVAGVTAWLAIERRLPR
jgi:hypothetical protein